MEFESIIPDFGHQYLDFREEIDDQLTIPKMKELAITIFVDSSHARDLVTVRSITGMICFVGRTPISYISKRQSAVQTLTFGAEFVALKKQLKKLLPSDIALGRWE